MVNRKNRITPNLKIHLRRVGGGGGDRKPYNSKLVQAESGNFSLMWRGEEVN